MQTKIEPPAALKDAEQRREIQPRQKLFLGDRLDA